ncbi:MAG: type III pantothenate kinase [Deltaproteobacteria bacterium]|nr:type III pantothenate kinase [Deltaproteobacteria bacterium]
MLLAIDVGNTNIVFGSFDGAKLSAHFRLATDHRRTPDEYGVLLRAMLVDAGLNPKDIAGVVMASVVPPLSDVLRAMCHERLKREPLVVGPGIKTGMPILTDNPREVGADRVVNGVAAYERFRHAPGGPFGLVIVDFGTATTFDVVSPKGEYLGGAISPGVMIAAEALYENAAKLPRIELVMPATAIGKSTVTSMRSGILFGYAGLVDGMVARMKGELDFAPKVIATGGLAPLVKSCAQSIESVDEFLTLEGLRIIHERNERGERA